MSFYLSLVLSLCLLQSACLLVEAIDSHSFALPPTFNEPQFQQKIRSTLGRIRKVLSREKQPLLAPASEVPHEYTDKYLLTELLGNIALSSTALTLESLGLTHDLQRKILSWVQTQDVSLKFTLTPSCVHSREETREVSGDKYVEEEHGLFTTKTTTKRVVRKIIEQFWDFRLGLSLQACKGGEAREECVDIMSDMAEQEIVTTATSVTISPLGDLQRKVTEINISPFLRHLDQASLLAAFSIDRNATTCHTPSRNRQVNELAQQAQDMKVFSESVSEQMRSMYAHSRQKNFFSSLFSGNAEEIFTPIIPILDYFDQDGVQHDGAQASENENSRLLSPSSLNALLQEEESSLAAHLAKFSGVDTPDPRDIITAKGAQTLVSLHHLSDIATALHCSVMYIEGLIRSQLISSIGKEVTARDVAEYTQFYAQKLLHPEVAPSPMAYAVRRSSSHSPEGIFSVDLAFPRGSSRAAAGSVPLFALSRQILSSSSPLSSPVMSFPLDASTRVQFSGDQFVHAYLHHSFSSMDEAKVTFTASARQFSSFVLMLGKVTSSSTFEPQHALVVRSKDELTVALDLAVIPTQKEFRDAIKSLSRNQQAFATAFRSMQLEGSLFGVLIIQIKPQLEKVLNLPSQSLQQEIELTEDLMELFVQHQIPSDLLMATPDDTTGNRSSDGGVDKVRANVRAIQGMLTRAKEKELKDKKQFDEYHNVRPTVATGYGGGGAPEMMEDMTVGVSSGLESRERGDGGARIKRKTARGMPQSDVMMTSFSAVNMMKSQAAASVSDSPPSPPSEKGDSSSSSSTPVHATTFKDAMAADTFEAVAGSGYDYTSLPQKLQDAFDKHGGENTLRPTIVTVDENSMILTTQPTLFSSRTTSSLSLAEQQQHKQQALNLLDALTRSGAVPVTHSSLHVLVATTHVFDRSVIETLVQKDINPLQRLEQSLLVMLQTLHDQPLGKLVSSQYSGEKAEMYPEMFRLKLGPLSGSADGAATSGTSATADDGASSEKYELF